VLVSLLHWTACCAVGKGSHHCLPANGKGEEPFAVVSTARAGSFATASVATGSVIVQAMAKRACAVEKDTAGAFKDVTVKCIVKP
jgi:hypothetical protein